jgi:ABC-2 type transport system permease protein
VTKTFLLIRNELKQQWFASATYVAGVVFLVPMVIFFWIVLKEYAEFPREELPMVAFYRIFWIPNLIVIPLLTMRSIAEERRQGTLETLMTTPLRPFELVVAKFASAYFSYAVFWLLTLLFPLMAHLIMNQSEMGAPLSASAQSTGAMAFILISGASYTAAGILCSSLTRSQLVAGMLSFTTIFLLLISGRLFEEVAASGMHGSLKLNLLVDYLHTLSHYETFALGLLDLQPILYYASTTLAFLVLASTIVERKT